MGEFTGIGKEREIEQEQVPDMSPGDVETDVADVKADGLAKDGMPIFTVSDDEFYRNMRATRKRLRFGSDTSVSKYMRGTRYNRPFWIRSEKDDYMRKIK